MARRPPVCMIAGKAARLPLKNLGLFFKLSWLTVLVTLALQLSIGILVAVSGKPPIWNAVWLLPYGAVITPFCVAWTRFTFLGHRGLPAGFPLRFGRREVYTIAASGIISVAVIGTPAGLGILTYLRWSTPYAYYLLTLSILALIVSIAVGLRLMFIVPEIALDRYQGLMHAWRLSKGVVLRVMLMAFLAQLPYSLARSVFQRIERSASRPDVASALILGAVGIFLDLLLAATGASAITFALRFTIRNVASSSIVARPA